MITTQGQEPSAQPKQPLNSAREEVKTQPGGASIPQKTDNSDKTLTETQTKELVDKLNDSELAAHTKLRFGFHEQSATYYVSVIDPSTQEVLRQFPSEEAMKLAQRGADAEGMLLDAKG